MFGSVFEPIYLLEYLLISIVRAVHTSPYRREKVAIDKKSTSDMLVLALTGLSMLTPLIYIFTSLFDFC